MDFWKKGGYIGGFQKSYVIFGGGMAIYLFFLTKVRIRKAPKAYVKDKWSLILKFKEYMYVYFQSFRKCMLGNRLMALSIFWAFLVHAKRITKLQFRTVFASEWFYLFSKLQKNMHLNAKFSLSLVNDMLIHKSLQKKT